MSQLKVNSVVDAAGGNTATINGMTPTAQSLQGFRNRIINGGMSIWQRGTSFSVTSGQYVQDRWFLYAPSGTFGSARSTDVPFGFQYSAELTGTDVSYTQRIEAANSFDLVGQSVTVSFWAKSVSGTANLTVILQRPGAADNWTSITDFASQVVSASPSGTWTQYTATFTNLPAQVANGLGVAIVRGAASASTTRITGVQLEAGSVATPFERRPYGTELALCQRYYQTLVLPARYVGGSSGTAARFGFTFAEMRSSPTCVLNATFANNYSPTGNDLVIWGLGATNRIAPTSASISSYGRKALVLELLASLSSGVAYELGTSQGDSGASILMSSEL